VADGLSYNDIAILYRTNAQSRSFEERLVLSNIPYKLVGGVNFYARKEIKDLLAYLKTVDNGRDEIAIRRIINIPKRGIGASSIARVQDYAIENNMAFFTALCLSEDNKELKSAAVTKIHSFTSFIQVLRAKAEYLKPSLILKEIIEETGYVRELELEDTDEARGRIENIDELLGKIVTYEESEEHPTLSGFLEEVALVADIDSLDEDSNHVILMTLHSAKGLEFPHVYLVGMEDGLFPSYMSINADNSREEIEEERRLAYVGITRAKTDLTLTYAKMRVLHGEPSFNKISRFVKEIPSELLDESESSVSRYSDPFAARAVQKPAPKKDNPFINHKNMYSSNIFDLPNTSKGGSGKANLAYTVGDRVRHVKFGEGIVQSIKDGGRDFEVTVEFDKAGVKKMFSSFAKLQKI